MLEQKDLDVLKDMMETVVKKSEISTLERMDEAIGKSESAILEKMDKAIG